MTLDELRALMARFTYKPESTFKVRTGYERGQHFLSVSVLCTDVNAPHKQNFVTNELPLWETDLETWTEDLVIARVENAIHSIERHEIQEWLRLDGKFISDPHPEVPHGKNYGWPRGRLNKEESPQAPMRRGSPYKPRPG